MSVKRWLLRRMPHPAEWLANSALLRPLAPYLGHPALWSLQRRKVALAVAVGLFSGLMPGPTQMLTAALLALLFRINLPVALACTLYTNPLTYLPLYYLAFELGKLLLGINGELVMPPFPVFDGEHLWQWQHAVLAWTMHMGWPLVVGVPALGLALGLGGYVIVMLLWQCAVLRQWRKRKEVRGSD